jgi:glycosyltransferase involved in cell wall biosynthesis
MPVPEPEPTSRRHAVSVAMATYEGAAYVEEQVRSILAQLHSDDELVIVDDASPDRTVEVVRSIDDDRVRVIEAVDNKGYVATFEAALRECRHDLLLLADQDDVWPPGRVEALTAALGRAEVAAGNVVLLGTGRALRSPFGGEGWVLRAGDSAHWVRNLCAILAGVRPYYGCAMGLRRSALGTVLPFPRFLSESHDLWLALCGNMMRSIAHVEDVVVLRRVHDSNQTGDRPRGIVPAVRSRIMLLRSLAEIARRLTRRAGSLSR